MANFRYPKIPTVARDLTGRAALLFGLLLLSVFPAQAQWLTQSFTLKPGWNAIYLHVDGLHQSLDVLIPDANSPVAEIWMWRPKLSTAQFIDNPNSPTGTDSRWAVWTSARGDTDTLQRLAGNGAYLVRNRTASDFTLTVVGKPVPPAYQWTTTGLNFIGFPTPTGAAPNFATFLQPAAGLDLAKTLLNSAKVFRYPGREAPATAPSLVPVVGFNAGSISVNRGEAFWVRGSTNYYNHYYGPVEVSLQNDAGIYFGDSLGTYSLRLKNRTSTSRTVTLNLVGSESAPSGQPVITAQPQLLVRGALSANLTYPHTVLAGHTVTLKPEGEAGSEQEVVLGLNRSLMTGAPGAFYAGILRITDSGGLQQVDLPVSANVPDASGLWVGQATVDRVGQYLRQYPKVSSTTTLTAALAQAGLPAEGEQVPGSKWVERAQTYGGRNYGAVASSQDGRRAVAAVSSGPGRLSVTSDYGVTWTERETAADRNYVAVACSADGSVMAAAANNGKLYVSADAGTTWVARASVLNWIGIACSADGRKLAAVVNGGLDGHVYVSSDGGLSWTAKDRPRNWSSIAMSEDGTKLVAGVNPGQLLTSTDSGNTWTARESTREWYAVASSADGSRLIACVDNEGSGGVFLSSDSGITWQATSSLDSRHWQGVATSIDGKRLAAVSLRGVKLRDGGQYISLSNDGGVTWTTQSPAVSSLAIAMSGDGTRVIALGLFYYILTLQRTFADYELDTATGLIRDQAGRYISSGVNTKMAKVPSPVPLRLILHNNATASKVSLLQRVFVGKGANTDNTVVANREQWLDATQIASARRISAPQLPFSLTNTVWTATANFNPGSVVTVTVPLDYNDHASNPFLHTFHPDHDNLDPKFGTVRKLGEESYSITRQLKLTFTSGGADFRSLTASAQGRSGTYEETITLGGKNAASREYQLSGTFSLQRISPVSTLTTQ